MVEAHKPRPFTPVDIYSPIKKTTFADAVREAVEEGGPHAARELRRLTPEAFPIPWAVPLYREIEPTVCHSAASAEIEKLAKHGRHPFEWGGGILGGREVAREVDDYHFGPFMLLIHRLHESKGRVATWDEAVEYFREGAGRDVLERMRNEGWYRAAVETGDEKKVHWFERSAMRRIGTFYQSSLREMHVLAVLRERHGIHMHYHPWVDGLLKQDLFRGNIGIAIFVDNDKFKGRKVSASKMTEGSTRYAMETVVMKDRTTILQPIWLHDRQEIDLLAEKIKLIINRPAEDIPLLLEAWRASGRDELDTMLDGGQSAPTVGTAVPSAVAREAAGELVAASGGGRVRNPLSSLYRHVQMKAPMPGPKGQAVAPRKEGVPPPAALRGYPYSPFGRPAPKPKPADESATAVQEAARRLGAQVSPRVTLSPFSPFRRRPADEKPAD